MLKALMVGPLFGGSGFRVSRLRVLIFRVLGVRGIAVARRGLPANSGLLFERS